MKEGKGLKIVIVLLVLIIVLLVGFGIFFIEELIDEKEEIRDLYDYDSKIYSDGSINNNNNDNQINNNNSDNNAGITSSNPNENYISKENALKTALDHAKINQNDIRNVEVELDYKYNQTVYEVTFDYKQYEYEYYINAENGNILKSFREID